MPIPVIDLFAGPGGLGEGFSSLRVKNQQAFKIKLSIEKDEYAHRTLELRAFYRNFDLNKAPDEYYDYLRGKVSREELFKAYPEEAAAATEEAWKATLGSPQLPKRELDRRIHNAIGNEEDWVLIGGPPCQAYSLVGRSRVIGKEDEGGIKKYEADPRHNLYRQYLRILAVHRPPVFVMENVKGLLSAKRRDEHIFERMCRDLRRPGRYAGGNCPDRDLEYKLYSLVKEKAFDIHEPESFIVQAEKYGIPQARHRVIILGIRSDLKWEPKTLEEQDRTAIEAAIGDLPKLRSGISKNFDSNEAWRNTIRAVINSHWISNGDVPSRLKDAILRAAHGIKGKLTRGGEFLPGNPTPGCHPGWYRDDRLKGFCNHSTRGHIEEDLHRYFYASIFARVKRRSPLLEDFPPSLLPKHKNVADALLQTKFNDRFRVQLRRRPSTTVVSHIAKDGHYFIHYDSSQCRSLTVREAARLQTFPDNYFFEGPRTQQYAQVGNAVPPLLARQIAELISTLFL